MRYWTSFVISIGEQIKWKFLQTNKIKFKKNSNLKQQHIYSFPALTKKSILHLKKVKKNKQHLNKQVHESNHLKDHTRWKKILLCKIYLKKKITVGLTFVDLLQQQRLPNLTEKKHQKI